MHRPTKNRVRALTLVTSGTSILAMALTLAPGAVAAGQQHHSPVTSVTRATSQHRLAAPSGIECFSNIHGATGSAYVSQNFESGFDQYDAVAADDFETQFDCTVTAIQVPGQYFNGSGPASSETVTFYSDDGGAPGSVIDAQTVAGTDDGTGSFTIGLSPVALSAHTQYWVSVQANMDFSIGGEWGWDADATQTENPATWENPADGFATGCTTWQTIQECLGADGPDLEFAIFGNLGDTSTTSAGYALPLQRQGVQKQGYQMQNIFWPLVNCSGHPNGYTVTFNIGGYMDSSDSGYYGLLTVTCINGLPQYSIKLCRWAWRYDSCRTVRIPIRYNDQIGSQIAARKGAITLTVTNESTGQQAKAKMKDATFTPVVASLGLSGLDPNQAPYHLDGLETQQFSKVFLNKKRLSTFDPQGVTLEQDGHAIVAPGAVGADGQSFDLHYVG